MVFGGAIMESVNSTKMEENTNKRILRVQHDACVVDIILERHLRHTLISTEIY